MKKCRKKFNIWPLSSNNLKKLNFIHRYYEVADDDAKPHVFYLSQFISGAPQRGFGVLPKRGCDTGQCEILRFYKLHTTRDLVEPISMVGIKFV